MHLSLEALRLFKCLLWVMPFMSSLERTAILKVALKTSQDRTLM